MKKAHEHRKIRIPIVWLMQSITILVFSASLSLSLLWGSILHAICMYLLLPLLCAYSAGRCVLRDGMNNYMAIIAPILLNPVGYLLIWGYLPGLASILVCSLITVAGAATGEVLRTQKKIKRR